MATYLQYADDAKQITGEYPTGLMYGARLHTSHGVFTQTATTIAQTTLECELPRLMPGKVVVYPAMSWLRADDADAGALLKLGYRTYNDSNLVAQVADDDYWMVAVAVGAGNIQGLWPAVSGVTTAGARPAVFDAQDGLRIFASVTVAMPNATDIIELVVVYSHID